MVDFFPVCRSSWFHGSLLLMIGAIDGKVQAVINYLKGIAMAIPIKAAD